MKEDLLHFLWRTRRFEQTGLRTTEGEPLEITAPGKEARDAKAQWRRSHVWQTLDRNATETD